MNKRVALIGDLILDKFINYKSLRLSPEGPAPVVVQSSSFEALEKLPGVGHKTASVVMSQGFGYPAFPVDTHIHRLAQRWGLTNGKSVAKTEKDLKRAFEIKDWNKLHLQIIFWGREFCQARSCHALECEICKKINPKRKRRFVHKRP